MKIGLDVDGVLADFYTAYENVIVQVTNVNRFPPRTTDTGLYPPVWDWPEYYGYSSGAVEQAWYLIKGNPNFWRRLLPLVSLDVFERIHFYAGRGLAVYFITDRVGRTAKRQTEAWLSHYGIEYPTVLIAQQGKGLCCKALGLDIYVDDKGENIVDVEQVSPSTRAYLLTRPYNQLFNVQRRISTVEALLRVEGL